MMGQHGGNYDRVFYSFNLYDLVPADHQRAIVYRLSPAEEISA